MARPTLEEVARAAGCSLATASKALAGRPEVAVATRARVHEAAKSLGYERRPRTLVSQPRRRSLLAAFDGFGSVYSAEVLEGALAAATKAGVEMIVGLTPTENEGGVDAAWLEQRAASGVLGILVVTATLADGVDETAGQLGVPVVCVDAKSRGHESITTIRSTNWAGAALGTQHLVDLGHRRIAFAGVNASLDFALERYAGYRSALERSGIEPDPALAFPGDTDYSTGFAIGTRIARSPRPPSAIMCLCDAVALGVIEGARRSGLRTPERLSVVGFDDLQPAHWSSPALTTVRQPLRRMGGLAVRTLLRMSEGHEPDSSQIQLATSLVVRSSTAPPHEGHELQERLDELPDETAAV